jgi:hypothetical protein
VFDDGTVAVGALTNSAPTDLTLSGGSVAENSAAGTTVGTVAGVDSNAGDSLTYSLVNSDGGRFAVDASTGVITLAGAVDYEAASSAHDRRARDRRQRRHLRRDDGALGHRRDCGDAHRRQRRRPAPGQHRQRDADRQRRQRHADRRPGRRRPPAVRATTRSRVAAAPTPRITAIRPAASPRA